MLLLGLFFQVPHALNIESVINELLLIDGDFLLQLCAWFKLFDAVSLDLVILHLYTVQHVLAQVVIFNRAKSNIIVAFNSFRTS